MCAWTETQERNHNFGRFRSASFLLTVLSLRVVGQITGFRCARARRTLFGEANSKRPETKAEKANTECRKEGERRNKTERKRERNREKRSVEVYPERLCKTWRHSPTIFCALFDRASRVGKLLCGTDTITNKQTNQQSKKYNNSKL